jgi:hypothetical protein
MTRPAGIPVSISPRRSASALSATHARSNLKVMPLFGEAFALIRANLKEFKKRGRVRLVAVGTLTDVQLDAIN